MSDVAGENHWWWSIENGEVEYGPAKFLDQRLGPYASKEEAERALDKVRERTEAWETDPIYGERS